MPFVESFPEFVGRMKCPYVVVPTGGRRRLVRFENGASSDGDYSHTEPPADPEQSIASRRAYFSVMLAAEEKAFKDFKAAVAEQAGWHRRCPQNCPPPHGAAAVLREGQARVLALREKLAELDGEFAALPEQVERRRVAETNGEFAHDLARRQEMELNEMLGICI